MGAEACSCNIEKERKKEMKLALCKSIVFIFAFQSWVHMETPCCTVLFPLFGMYTKQKWSFIVAFQHKEWHHFDVWRLTCTLFDSLYTLLPTAFFLELHSFYPFKTNSSLSSNHAKSKQLICVGVNELKNTRSKKVNKTDWTEISKWIANVCSKRRCFIKSMYPSTERRV